MLCGWEATRAHIFNELPEPGDTLSLHSLLHQVQIAVLLRVAWIRWSVVPEYIVGKQKLNVTAATCADRRGQEASSFANLSQQLRGNDFNLNRLGSSGLKLLDLVVNP